MQKIYQLGNKNKIHVLGIMNGTSLDGVDFVIIEIEKSTLKIKLKNFQSFKFPQQLRNTLYQATVHLLKVDNLALLHHDLGRFYASCFKKLKSKKNIDLIGLHGQTVFHKTQTPPSATLQIGEASYLSAISQLPVVADFRPADLSLGGQGAPIATLFHQLLFSEKSKVAVHNLGGISNTTLLKNKATVAAFDTGPGNMLLDLAVQKYSKNKMKFDKNGRLAFKGNINLPILKKMLQHPFFKKPYPKSCGREEFGEIFLNKYPQFFKLSLFDQLATLTELTAVTIVHSYKINNFHPKKIIFCGGGANNQFLLRRIQSYLPTTEVRTCKEYGWPVETIEGAAFALLAAYFIWGKTNNIPKTTGASRAAYLGKLVYV